MNFENLSRILGTLGAALMPLCNIPLIARIIRRKSADDISLGWVIGVEICVLAMLPSSLHSVDPVLRIYGISNSIFFSIVTAVVCFYHSK